jgi:hypothetical protein
LGSISNFAVCNACGYSGPLATPIVYHDAEKELLLTFFPGELGVPLNEQEKLIGPLITQVSNRLAPEKRKAYLLRPQSFLTYQSLIERILGADGITPEMIQAQQQRVALIERLLAATTPGIRSEIIKEKAGIIDSEFFAIFTRLAESAHASGQEQASNAMQEIQKQLLTETEYGRKVASQSYEIQEAIKTLQAAGKNLDRERLLGILIDAPNDDRLNALVSMTRPGIDYLFFQALTERIEQRKGDERNKLEQLRSKLLEITRKLDQRAEEELKKAEALLQSLLSSENIQQATIDHLDEINELFIQVLNRAIQEANKKNDEQLMPKLQQIVAVLQQASAPPPELALLEQLLAAESEDKLSNLIQENKEAMTPEFTALLVNVITRNKEQSKDEPAPEDAQLLAKLEAIYRAVLKFTMSQKLSGS